MPATSPLPIRHSQQPPGPWRSKCKTVTRKGVVCSEDRDAPSLCTNERSQQTVNGLILYRKSQGRLEILDGNEGVTHCLEKVVPGNLPFFGCLPQ